MLGCRQLSKPDTLGINIRDFHELTFLHASKQPFSAVVWKARTNVYKTHLSSTRPEDGVETGLDIDHYQEDDQFADLDIASAVDRLLSMPFEAAMKTSKELRDYVRNPKRSKDEIADLEAEFAQSWSLEAPTELRDILEELLFPDVVAARQARESREPIARL